MGDLQFLNLSLDEEVQGGNDFSPFPAGDYNLLIEEAEIKRTKNGEGQYLALRLQVLDGPHKGRLLFDRITIQHSNDKAVEIGRKALIVLSRAIGQAVSESAQLLNKTCRAKVKIRPEQNGYAASNEVAWYIGPVTSAAPPPRPQAEVVRRDGRDQNIGRQEPLPQNDSPDDCPF